MALILGMSKGLALKMKTAIWPYLKTKIVFFLPLVRPILLDVVGGSLAQYYVVLFVALVFGHELNDALF